MLTPQKNHFSVAYYIFNFLLLPADIKYNENCDCWLTIMKSMNKMTPASAQKHSSLLFKGWLLSNALLKLPSTDIPGANQPRSYCLSIISIYSVTVRTLHLNFSLRK